MNTQQAENKTSSNFAFVLLWSFLFVATLFIGFSAGTLYEGRFGESAETITSLKELVKVKTENINSKSEIIYAQDDLIRNHNKFIGDTDELILHQQDSINKLEKMNKIVKAFIGALSHPAGPQERGKFLKRASRLTDELNRKHIQGDAPSNK
ncbi:MAG: hypothetical protein HGB08_01985 [Candidatus Moranbacteria bacterium]|nr:hypothetical protein [Candidatus Moranbacteria bacterium]